MDSVIKEQSIHILRTPDLFQQAAADFAKRAALAIADKDNFTVVLSGGETVKAFFNALVNLKENIPWSHIQFFFGDERYVPANDKASNYHTAQEYLFSKVPVPAENIFPIPTTAADPKTAAKEYEKTLRTVLHSNTFPKFDLIYLGLGEDCHTASLMPHSDVVNDYVEGRVSSSLVAALWVERLNMYRITLTPPAINHSDTICFLVTGANKAAAVRQTLLGPYNPAEYPAQLITTKRQITWWLDLDAARKISHI